MHRANAVSSSSLRDEEAPRRSDELLRTPRRSSVRAGELPKRSRTLLYSIVGVLLAISLAGLPYYVLPVAERVRSPLHPWLRPSGYIGQSAGILAVTIFVFLWLYPLRKRVRWLAWTGTIARWLQLHVMAALVLPLLVAIHSAWRFEGLIGAGVAAMMVVWLSGIVGRYLYTSIPRSKTGVVLSLQEIAIKRGQLFVQIAAHTGLDLEMLEAALAVQGPPEGRLGLWGTLRRLFKDDWARRRAVRRFRYVLRRGGPQHQRLHTDVLTRVMKLARQEMAFTQQEQMLDATQALFRFWHVLHRPVAIAALIAVLIHVTVVIALGATWLR
jgi:dihydropyrimidine dehydrogenase (NAD+) subunit PreT